MTDLLRNMLFIALGGALGALARFGAANLVHVLWPSRFPFATLAINVMVGFLGAYTTFSTFSLESVTLIENGFVVQALGYMLGSVCLCVGGAWAGIVLARLLWTP